MTSEQHRWTFHRSGGVDQVVIRSGADIWHLPQLDQKLWVTLACPTRGLHFDERTLDLIDTDHDGRIRAPEIIQAVEWLKGRLKDFDLLLQPGDSMPLVAFNESENTGALLASAARFLLRHAGKPEDGEINLQEVIAGQARFMAAPLNGDGVLVPGSAPDPELNEVLTQILASQEVVQDRGGKPGVNQAAVENFFAGCTALLEWNRKPASDPDILPLGDRTPPAVLISERLKPKIDDYFTRCRIGEYHPQAIDALNPPGSAYQALEPELLSGARDEIAKLPLAVAAPKQPLPLQGALNPAWSDAVANFRTNTAEPLLGKTLESLEEKDWLEVQRRLASYQKWQALRPGGGGLTLGVEKLEQLCSGELRQRLLDLLKKDAEQEPFASQLGDLEKLLRLRRDFARLLNNFISFSDFYARRGAIFQAGTLYLDARSCDLTVWVHDAAKHAGLAGLARAYLMYCDCTRPGEKMTVCAAFTAGDSDYLMVGRNGLFYDRQGRDWDATITKVIESPISIRQAFLSPYKKFVRMIEEQVAKRAAASDAEAQGKLSNVATSVATADKTAPAAPAQPTPPEKRKIDVGTVAALGVALGSISAVLVAVFTKFVDLGWWIPVAILGIILAISGPSMLIAALKLRQRNLGPILDANGWAVNGRMKINIPFGASLSKTASLPPRARLQAGDPFAEDHTIRNLIIFLIVVGVVAFGLWRKGYLAGFGL